MIRPSKRYSIVFIGVLLVGALLFYTNKKKNFISSHLEIKSQKSEITETPPQIAKRVSAELDEKVSTLAPDEKKNWALLLKILDSKNDNDPRLDKNFKNLSLSFHEALKKKYNSFPMEKRNERGLIAFLIARDLKSIDDLDFLKSIYEETPCLGLENCSVISHDDPHHSGINQTSANYPQLITLYQLEKQLQTNPQILSDNNLKDHLSAVIDQAARFQVPAVRKKAEEVRDRFHL